MANTIAFWKQVNELAATLPEEVVLVSIENPTVGTHAGAICIASRKVAAQRLVERTHVRASDEQIAQNKAHEAESVRLAQERDNRRAPKTVLVVGQEHMQQFAPALAEAAKPKKEKSA